MFKIAHLTDPHLAPLPPASPGQLLGKRITGFLSWHLRRKEIYLRSVLDTVTADLRSFAPDHVALTGDLINIALPAEYRQARGWLEALGPPDWITLAPGNHDMYVRTTWQSGLSLWADYFAGDNEASPTYRDLGAYYPLVRFRRNVAVIAASTASPTRIGSATGILGRSQLDSLRSVLADTRQRGFYRMLLIHHPPMKHLAPPRKELRDAGILTEILAAEGCELVVYGHNHIHQNAELASPHGPVHMFGLPSSSQILDHGCTAAWTLYEVRRQEGIWTTDITIRSFNPRTAAMETMKQYRLSHR